MLGLVRPIASTKLTNGVTVTSEYWKSPVLNISIVVKAGSRTEKMEQSGVAHFVEHMLYHGTNSRSHSDITTFIESNGLSYYASTSRESTIYSCTTTKENIEAAMAILSDFITFPKFDIDEIEKERRVILSEAYSIGQNKMEEMVDAIHYTAYQSSMMGYPILGNRHNIPKITKAMLQEFHSRNYIGPNINIVVTGNAPSDKVIELATKLFSEIPNAPPNADTKVESKPNV